MTNLQFQRIDVPSVRRIAESAGRKILSIYHSGDWTVTAKSDESPVTQADLIANQVITQGLRNLTIEQIVSEESDPLGQSFDTSKPFWLIDPLDGTRDFVNRLDTFVVCIARVECAQPTFGLIHCPVTGETWWAERGQGAYGSDDKKLWHPKERSGGFIAAGSRSMPSDRMKIFCEFFDVAEVRRYGSALKFCHLAEGKIDLYPRFGPTNEWDTAAGQLIAEEAGCKVIDISTQMPLAYGKSEFINGGGFVASRSDLEFVGRLEELRSKLPK